MGKIHKTRAQMQFGDILLLFPSNPRGLTLRAAQKEGDRRYHTRV